MPCATSTPLCSIRSTPTWPFDVKPPTYEPIGLMPTCEPQARTDHERQLIFICVNKGKQKDVKYIFYKNLPHPLSYL